MPVVNILKGDITMLKTRNQRILFRVLLLSFTAMSMLIVLFYKYVADLIYVGVLLFLFLLFLIEKYWK